MKISILLAIIAFCMISTSYCDEHDHSSGSELINKYKDLQNPFGRHSLFTDSNAENVSNSIYSIPPPIPQK